MAETKHTQIDKIWNVKFIQITLINFLLSMGQFMMNTLVPKYADSLGAPATVVGIVTSMFAITALGIRPISGPAMDYFPKNKLMRISVSLIVIAFIGYGFSNSITLIMISRLVHGLGVGVAIPLSMAMASNTLPKAKMASGMSIFSMGNAVGTAVGPSIGLELKERIGYSATFFIVAGILGVCFIMTLLLQSNTHAHKGPFKIRLDRIIVPAVIVPAIIMLFIGISYSSISSFIVIYGGLRGVDEIGFYFTAYAVCLLASRPISGKVADKFGIDKTIIPGFILFAVSFVLISLSRSLTMFLIAGCVSAFGYGICIPLMMTLAMQLVPSNLRGAASNTNFIGMDSGYLLGPVIAGLLITGVYNATGSEATGYSVMYLVMILPIAAALVIFILRKKKLLAHLKFIEEETAE